MHKEKSCGAIVFHRNIHSVKFLLLHYGKGHWGFPKGHVEKGETEEQTLFRELEEETGITSAQTVPGFREELGYFFKEGRYTISKTVAFFLVESAGRGVRLSEEHSEFKWLPFDKAFESLTFTNAKNLLRKADSFLQQANQKDK